MPITTITVETSYRIEPSHSTLTGPSELSEIYEFNSGESERMYEQQVTPTTTAPRKLPKKPQAR